MTTFNQQGQHVDSQFYINSLNVTTLSHIDNINESTKRRLISLYEIQIRECPEQAKYYLALGLFYLDRRLYSHAVRALENAHDIDPLNANTLYYLALAYIGGRQLGTLKYSTVQHIENCIRAATEIDNGQAHYLYLWAFLKYECFLVNSLRDSPPAIEELVRLAQGIPLDRNEAKHMLEYIQLSDNPVLDLLLDRFLSPKPRKSFFAFLQRKMP